MIASRLIHPDILGALARTGHRARILVTDAHYATSTAVNPRATICHLGYTPGAPTIPEIVELIAENIAIEASVAMQSPPDVPREVQEQIATALADGIPHHDVTRQEFYNLARSQDVALCVVTGDTRRFGNVLLTVGVTATVR